jgi:hypothetical protein
MVRMKDRGYVIQRGAVRDLTSATELAITDSVVFSQDTEKPLRILGDLDRYGKKLLDFDCRVYIRVAAAQHLRERARAIVINAITTLQLPPAGLSSTEAQSLHGTFTEREGSMLAPFVYICDSAVTWAGIFNLIVANPSGRPPNLTLKIEAKTSEGKRARISGVQALLIQRAFWDCDIVHLIQMADGLSGAPAYRVYAEPTAGLLGSWPSLHFLKTGPRAKITTEYDRYLDSALLYVPFHLGPRLNLERCGLGAQDGILVGDFVEDAESLQDCASQGRAATAIANLFNRTLRGWRNRSKNDSSQFLSHYLRKFFPSEIPDHRQPLIRSLGAARSLAELWELV